jgi:hypothetical protein
MYRKSARYGFTYSLSLVILSEAKNHLPQHSADQQQPSLRPAHAEVVQGPCNPYRRTLSISEPYLLRTTHYPLRTTQRRARGVPARGGYPTVIPSIAR